jgi:hypothetical protein
VTLTASVDGGTAGIAATLDVTSASTQLGTVTLKNTAGASVDFAVTLQGAGGAVNISTIDSVVKDGLSNGGVTLTNLRTSGNFGSIAVDAVLLMRVGGSLTGTITVSNGDLGTLWVDGNVSGNAAIHVNGTIGFINLPNADSDFGNFNNPADIWAAEQINDIFVYDDLWANVLVQATQGSGAFGPVGRIENADGGIGGTGYDTWKFAGFDAISAGVAGLYAAGNFRSPLTIEGPLDEPIVIGSSLITTLEIKGTASAAITIGGGIG